MNKIPQIESISRMKHQYNEVIAHLDAGPVVLTQNSKPVAVLVSPEQWNASVDELEDMKDIIAGLRTELAMALGEDTFEIINPDTFMDEIAGEAVSS
jgi:prevent-host-death family protein